MEVKSNLVIWLLGTNSSGKTSQAKNLLGYFGNGEKIIHKGTQVDFDENSNEVFTDWTFTSAGDGSACLGTINDNDCCGTDTLKNKLEIAQSYHEATKHSTVVVIDGIMATATWIDWIRSKKVMLVVVLLEFPNNEQLRHRIKVRRAKKKRIKLEEVVLTDATIANIEGKVANFHRLFDKMKLKADASVIIDASLPQFTILDQIINTIRG